MDENKTSSWDDLLQQLGAKPAPDALERKRPAIETQLEPPTVAAPPPKPKRGDWNALADQFGIEASNEPERLREGNAPSSEVPAGSSEAMEASFAEIEPMESTFEEFIEEEISDVEFEVDEDFGGTQPEPTAGDSSALSGEAARSAFEALFEAGSFSALPPIEKTPRKPEGRPGPQWRDFDERPRREREKAVDEDLEEEELKGDAAEESSEQSERPRRRRRRRGRGRGRHEDERREHEPANEGDQWDEGSEEEEGAEHAEAGEQEFDDAESGEKRRRRRRGRGGRGERPAHAESSAEAEEDAYDDDQSDESAHEDVQDQDEGEREEGLRGSHKSIPTWGDAIGVMVETNMQSRKNAPQRPGGARDRGRGGRGRGRGGRGRRS